MKISKLPIDLPPLALLDASPYPQAAYDLEFRVWAVNRKHSEVTGVAREGMIGQHLFEVFPPNPDDPASNAQPPMAASLARMVESGATDFMDIVKHDVRHEGGDFHDRYWQISHSPIWSNGDGTGEIIGALQTTRDVTAEVQRQKINAAQQRSAMIGGQLMFFELDQTTGYVKCEAELQELYGYDPVPGGLPLQALFDRIHQEDRDAVICAVDAARDAVSHTQSQVDYRVVHPDRTMRWVSARMEVVRGREAGPSLLTGVVLDVTDLRQSEADLRRAVRDRDLMIAEVHHRVKNSLQLVTSVLNIEAASAAGTDASERLKCAAARVQAIATVHSVLYQSDDVSRVELGSFLRTLVEHIAASAGAAERGIEVEMAIAEDPVWLATDRAIAASLILNELVTNAFKHAFPAGCGGTVTVALEGKEPGTIAVIVADNGIGYMPANAPAPSAATLSGGGLGSTLITALSQQIGASLTNVEPFRSADAGCRVGLELDI